MCSRSRKSDSTQYIFLDFLDVIEECISFHLVYRLLLLQFVLGWAIFYHKSPGLCQIHLHYHMEFHNSFFPYALHHLAL